MPGSQPLRTGDPTISHISESCSFGGGRLAKPLSGRAIEAGSGTFKLG